MKLTFSNSDTSKQLLIAKEDLEFFQKIKKENIQLDLEFNGKITNSVLDGKQINETCPDITKLGDIKDELINNSIESVKIKKITIELEKNI